MSLSAFTQKIEEIYQIIDTMKEKFAVEKEKIQALDVSSSDALEQWQAAKKSINDFNVEQVTKYNTFIREANAIRSGLSKEEEVQANELAKTVISQFNTLKSTNRQETIEAFADVKQKIDSGKKETNPSEADQASQEKVANAGVASASASEQSSVDGQTQTSSTEKSESSPLGRTMPAPSGAMPKTPTAASVNFKSITGEEQPKDMRVKIRVPRNYLTQLTSGLTEKSKVLEQFSGIIFPYTPQIGFEHKAEYSAQQPLHSNYTQYFYQRSSVSAITITGKFTVSNEDDAIVYIATVHLLRALTKMRYGGTTGDADSGSPPPVCRLDAYGTFQLDNVPVVISSFKTDLPDNVDYYTVGKKTSTIGNRLYEKTSVPVISTISLNLLPVYSRDEMQKFNVTQWLNEKYVRKAGYL